jgi:predicted nucleic acid-binding protein
VIFVDSSAWFAVYSLRDSNHSIATATIHSLQSELVTSDYVIDETLTLLRARNEDQRAIAFGNRVIEGNWVNIVRIEDADFADAWTIFRTYSDKGWSFTDCTSRVLMERLGITKAFAFDEHFRQFGMVRVVP